MGGLFSWPHHIVLLFTIYGHQTMHKKRRNVFSFPYETPFNLTEEISVWFRFVYLFVQVSNGYNLSTILKIFIISAVCRFTKFIKTAYRCAKRKVRSQMIGIYIVYR